MQNPEEKNILESTIPKHKAPHYVLCSIFVFIFLTRPPGELSISLQRVFPLKKKTKNKKQQNCSIACHCAINLTNLLLKDSWVAPVFGSSIQNLNEYPMYTLFYMCAYIFLVMEFFSHSANAPEMWVHILKFTSKGITPFSFPTSKGWKRV